MGENFNVRDYLAEGVSEEEINRCEFWVMANRITRKTGKPNHEEAKIQVNQDWNFEILEKWLQEYEDKEIIEYLKYGWPLNNQETKINTKKKQVTRKECKKIKQLLTSTLKRS